MKVKNYKKNLYMNFVYHMFQQNVKRQLITSSQESSSVSHSKPGKRNQIEEKPIYHEYCKLLLWCGNWILSWVWFSVSGHHIHIPNNLLSQMPAEVIEILELEPSWDFNIISLEKATAKRWAEWKSSVQLHIPFKFWK